MCFEFFDPRFVPIGRIGQYRFVRPLYNANNEYEDRLTGRKDAH